MSDVILVIKTNKVGSTVKVDTGYTPDEWELLEEKDKKELVIELVFENIEVWEEFE